MATTKSDMFSAGSLTSQMLSLCILFVYAKLNSSIYTIYSKRFEIMAYLGNVFYKVLINNK